MRKGIIITASILLTAGLLIFIGGLLLGGGMKPMQFETKTYPVTEPVADIRLDTHRTDILILPSPGSRRSLSQLIASSRQLASG